MALCPRFVPQVSRSRLLLCCEQGGKKPEKKTRLNFPHPAAPLPPPGLVTVLVFEEKKKKKGGSCVEQVSIEEREPARAFHRP
jgi:hypothetical protein